jgi:N-methylhydantoinase A
VESGSNDQTKASPAIRVGVDTGGTFTDFVWLAEDGRISIGKRLSTPADPAEAVLAGIDTHEVAAKALIVHGSTVATNALLERRGARTALITTKGFADVLFIGRQNRADLYALVPQNPEPLVPRSWRFEVKERVTSDGEILLPLDEASLETVVEQVSGQAIESVAICLLFSFLRPEHEQQIRDRLKKLDRPLHLSLSSDILPEFREFERTSTTVINAYVAPLMENYLSKLNHELTPRLLTIMQSNGGIIRAKRAGVQAARTVLSGPAGGVVGARYTAGLAGYDDIISFDMGGTSTDVALCPGRLLVTSEGEIGGFPLRLPMIDIHTVGAGGGSLAYVDPGGALRVGPQSAGADPGPACYGRSIVENGEPLQATTTDANLILGRLDKNHFLGGTMLLDFEAASRVLEKLAGQMAAGSAAEAAWGVLRIANANMQRALRRISVERGYDPRNFTLVAFGGAGPLHACELAQSLQIPRVFVPPVPGVLSALGMLAARPSLDYSQTIMRRLAAGSDSQIGWLDDHFQILEARALSAMEEEGHSTDRVTLLRQLDMRYVGQSHELTVTIPRDKPELHLAQRFHETHEARYAYKRPDVAVEIVNVRCVAVAMVQPPRLQKLKSTTPDISEAVLGSKKVWFNDQSELALLLERDKLTADQEFDGPAIVFQYDTTTVVPPEWQAVIDEYGNLLLQASH